MHFRSKRGQASIEFLMTYGWLFLVIVIAGAALNSMGFLNPGTYVKSSCVGFQKLHYRDHLLGARRETGLFDIPDDNVDGNDRESLFNLRLQNGFGKQVMIKEVLVEFPEGVVQRWTDRGYACETFNRDGETNSGCQQHNLTEAEIVTLRMEDVGAGTLDLLGGNVYRAKVKVTYDSFGELQGMSETAICSGKIELGGDDRAYFGNPVPIQGYDLESDFGGATAVYAADIDGDGDVDVLGAGYDVDTIAWWENLGGASGWDEHLIDSSFLGVRDAYAADLNGDGDMDVVGAAFTGDEIAWWENDGASPPTFTKHSIDSSFDGARAIHAIDLDGDSDIDVLGAGALASEVA